ncbi:MAG: type IX secretion system protein PorQ [Muribaculaceae bacterium]|nr:type IX secretion system protein PorQ [Muribaculaceae bacterium]
MRFLYIVDLKIIFKYLTLLLFISCVGSVRAQEVGSAYNFLNITSSSKIYGLGGVNISLVDDDFLSADQNPALLGQEMSGQIGLSYMHYLGGSNFASLGYTHSAGEHGAWAASIKYFGYGAMNETDANGNILGKFSPLDMAFTGSYSHDITDRLRGGIDIRLLYSSYAEFSAFALSTDLGINYYDEEHDLSLSFVAANLGGQLKKFNESADRLPIDVRLGWSQSFGSFPVRFSITAWNLCKWKLPYYESGDGTSDGDFEIKESFMSNLFRHLVFSADLISSPNWYIGLGYNYKTRTDMATYHRSFLSGWSVGAGINVKAFKVGVALSQPHVGGTSFMFNLNCSIEDILN